MRRKGTDLTCCMPGYRTAQDRKACSFIPSIGPRTPRGRVYTVPEKVRILDKAAQELDRRYLLCTIPQLLESGGWYAFFD
jgi:hypothetical protein